MSVQDYYLRFPDEETSFSIAAHLEAVVVTPEGPLLVRFNHRYAIDVIGEIYTDAVYDSQGNITTPSEKLPGWHVNLRVLDGTPLPEDLHQYIVSPALPSRVWA
jgi:hypothetical protein